MKSRSSFHTPKRFLRFFFGLSQTLYVVAPRKTFLNYSRLSVRPPPTVFFFISLFIFFLVSLFPFHSPYSYILILLVLVHATTTTTIYYNCRPTTMLLYTGALGKPLINSLVSHLLKFPVRCVRLATSHPL